MVAVRWLTVPGLWRKDDIRKVDWLPNAAPPFLRVAHINKQRFKEKRRLYGLDVPRPPPPGPSFTSLSSMNFYAMDHLDGPDETNNTLTLIEDREMLKWSIPVHNGVSGVQ